MSDLVEPAKRGPKSYSDLLNSDKCWERDWFFIPAAAQLLAPDLVIQTLQAFTLAVIVAAEYGTWSQMLGAAGWRLTVYNEIPCDDQDDDPDLDQEAGLDLSAPF